MDIEKLQGADDYHVWKYCMRMFLLGCDLWGSEGSETMDEHNTDPER